MERDFRAAEDNKKPVEQLASELAELDPQPVSYFTPDNLDEVMEDFLSCKRRNPDNASYSKLDSIDFEEQESKYIGILEDLRSHPEIPGKHHRVYEAYITRSLNVLELMKQARIFRTAESEDEKAQAEQEFKRLNHELYGGVDPRVAASMAREIADDTANAENPAIIQLRKEFLDLLPQELKDNDDGYLKLEPSSEAKATVQRAVESMYSPLLKHADKLIDDLRKLENKPADKLKLHPQQTYQVSKRTA